MSKRRRPRGFIRRTLAALGSRFATQRRIDELVRELEWKRQQLADVSAERDHYREALEDALGATKWELRRRAAEDKAAALLVGSEG